MHFAGGSMLRCFWLNQAQHHFKLLVLKLQQLLIFQAALTKPLQVKGDGFAGCLDLFFYGALGDPAVQKKKYLSDFMHTK